MHMPTYKQSSSWMPAWFIAFRGEWEALRVRALANHDTLDTNGGLGLGTGVRLHDFELRLAVPAVETGTLNRSAAILMQAGFASRLAAIKAVHDAGGRFQSAAELGSWLKSEQVEKLTAATNWPSAETSETWKAFRASYAPSGSQTWKKSSAKVDTSWHRTQPCKGSPVHLVDDPKDARTLVLSPDLELMGTLRRRLNTKRLGLTLAAVSADSRTM